MWGTLLQLGAGAIGEMMAGKSEDEQRYLMERAYQEFGKIDAPSIEAILAQELGPSAMEGVQADAGLAGIQRSALDDLLKVGREGGMTLQDKANLNNVQGRVARQNNAANQRVQEDIANRGLGAGSSLAATLANNQASAQRASEGGLEVAGMAQRRAMDSMMEGGRLAGQMRGQDFGEKTQRASAADARNRYNADAHTRAAQYNAGLQQQRFSNQMGLAQGRSGQLGQQAGLAGQKANSQRQLMAGVGKAASDTAKAYEDDEEGGW